MNSTLSTGQLDYIEATEEQPSKKLAAFAVTGLFAVFVASVLFSPPGGDYFSICGFKNFTGLPCPGCGLTHSFCAIGKGDFTTAFTFNLLGPPLFVAFILLWIRSACVLLNKAEAVQAFARITSRFNVVRAFAIAFAVYGVARVAILLADNPASFNQSPLSKLIGRLID